MTGRPIRARVKALTADQLQALRDTWPNDLAPPLHLTAPQDLERAHAIVDRVVGWEEPGLLAQARTAAMAALHEAVGQPPDPDLLRALIAYTFGGNRKLSTLDVDEVNRVRVMAERAVAGELVVRFTDNGDPYFMPARVMEHEAEALDRLVQAYDTGATPHPEDDTIGRWRAVIVAVGPAGGIFRHHLAGQQAAEVIAQVDARAVTRREPHTTTSEEDTP